MRMIKKDITTVTRGIIAHGCNCQGVMGSGAAKAIRDKFPEIFPPYYGFCRDGGFEKDLLGEVVFVYVAPQLVVANMLTQHRYGTSGKFADPDAIHKALLKTAEHAWYGKVPLYSVRVGALRGGLDWDTEVEPIYQAVQSVYPDLEIFICDI